MDEIVTLSLPGYLEVGPESFKETGLCNYAEVIAALGNEKDSTRRGQIEKLLRDFGHIWKQFPLMIASEVFKSDDWEIPKYSS